MAQLDTNILTPPLRDDGDSVKCTLVEALDCYFRHWPKATWQSRESGNNLSTESRQDRYEPDAEYGEEVDLLGDDI